MTPSERIQEICEEKRKAHGINGICKFCRTLHHPPEKERYFDEAVLKYLDEEYYKPISQS